MTIAWDKAAEIEARIDRIATQYRESPNLIALMRSYMEEFGLAAEAMVEIASAFDLETKGGDQLTIIGKWLGWPRHHPNGQLATFFGFDSAPVQPFGGFGETPPSEWDTAGSEAEQLLGFNPDADPNQDPDYFPVDGFCGEGIFYTEGAQRYRAYDFSDDEEYRVWLKAMQRRLQKDYRRGTLAEAATGIFGSEVVPIEERAGEMILCLTRAFTVQERRYLHKVEEVLPVTPGALLRWAQSEGSPFGFGAGWGELGQNGFYKIVRDPFARFVKSPEFGFGPQQAGFREGSFNC